jgi:hypothetical protein
LEAFTPSIADGVNTGSSLIRYVKPRLELDYAVVIQKRRVSSLLNATAATA